MRKPSAYSRTAYSKISRWNISRSSMRSLRSLPSCLGIVTRLTSIKPNGPKIVAGEKYDNFLLAMGLTDGILAKTLSELPNLVTLKMKEFIFPNHNAFFEEFAERLSVKKLKHLTLSLIEMENTQIAKIIETHKSTLISVKFRTLDVDEVKTADDWGEPGPRYLVFRSSRSIEKKGSIEIKR